MLAVDLQALAERLEISDQTIADAIGRDRTTVSRIRRRKAVPDAATMLALDAWAEGVARAARIPRRDWLSWEWVAQRRWDAEEQASTIEADELARGSEDAA
jgi:transcriptional regulator with XRE-family HTH domain